MVFPRFGGHLSAEVERPRQRRFPVPKTRPPFPAEFRREAVKLMRDSDKPVPQLAKDLGCLGEHAA